MTEPARPVAGGARAQPPPDAQGTATELHVAVVHDAYDVLYVAAAASRSAAIRQVADYVASHAADHLHEPEAKHVASLLEAGEAGNAVRAYFEAMERPGHMLRWGRERVVVRAVPVRRLPVAG